jgi:RNA polymerase sigma-70 factor, ECF subfamily
VASNENMTAVSARSEAPAVEATELARARAGDHEAFAALIRSVDEGLRALAYRLLGDRDRMDDALQEAYVRAFRGLPRFRGDSALATWLYRIVYNVCQEELRRSSRFRVVEPAREAQDPASVAETVEVRAGLVAALAALAPEDRAAVLLVDAQGFDYRAAAEILDVPEGTIASRLNRARALLRSALAEEGDS